MARSSPHKMGFTFPPGNSHHSRYPSCDEMDPSFSPREEKFLFCVKIRPSPFCLIPRTNLRRPDAFFWDNIPFLQDSKAHSGPPFPKVVRYTQFFSLSFIVRDFLKFVTLYLGSSKNLPFSPFICNKLSQDSSYEPSPRLSPSTTQKLLSGLGQASFLPPSWFS